MGGADWICSRLDWKVYAYFQWYYDIPSREVVVNVLVDFLIKAYGGLHDLDLELAAKKVGCVGVQCFWLGGAVSMMKYTFYEPEEMIRHVDAYFDHNYEYEWFDDPFVHEMVLKVDKTKVLSATAAESPIWGVIPITKLSGGVKALILMLKQDRPVWSPACGDNCTEFMIKIGEKRDFLMYVGHYLHFPCDFTAECVDNGQIVRTADEYYYTAIQHFILKEI